jgi:integrase
MEVLGHSQISLTMNTYSHVMPTLLRDAADKMDAILSGGR